MAETKTAPVPNGVSPRSTTLRHLLTLPAVQDGVRAFSANPIGKMSIRLTNSVYELVGAPMLSLFNKPLAYVIPYAQRADEFGVETLYKVEEKYPLVKKPSSELLSDAKEAASQPARHVAEVYNGAYKKAGTNHTIASAKAAVETAAIVTFEGSVFAIRETLKLGQSFQITESLNRAVDRLEEIIKRQHSASTASAVNHDQAEPQNAPEPKTSIV
ncbi:uncharacterized protein B0H64DRAFT_393340 [Chaetomium fimeti]|jgi:hypothetical protein|uniref:Uncharacterized protein n=1 Tax=Chaetomium fimeti TaxID=1854472 RepID=A0AAE0HJV8_9PEZI|nr:hypothetical protein B0H64DRAFT_393340 [Chaetomium fimeti]